MAQVANRDVGRDGGVLVAMLAADPWQGCGRIDPDDLPPVEEGDTDDTDGVGP